MTDEAKSDATGMIVTPLMGADNIFQSEGTTGAGFEYFNWQQAGSYAMLGGPESIPTSLAWLDTVNISEMTEMERERLCRQMYKYHPVVGTAVDIHTEVPLSKIKLTPVNIPGDPQMSAYVHHVFQEMIDKIRLFSSLIEIAHEVYLMGKVVIWVEYDEKLRMWSSMTVLPPSMVEVKKDPFSKGYSIDYVLDKDDPEIQKQMKQLNQSNDINDEEYEKFKEEGRLSLPSNPYEGSFAVFLERRSSSVYQTGVSFVERSLRWLILEEFFLAALEATARRSLKVRQYLSADGISPQETARLQNLIWLSQQAESMPIVVNYEITPHADTWAEKFPDFTSVLDMSGTQVQIGFGLTHGFMTGEGSYGGEHISLEIINTRYFLFREMITYFVEEYLFKPIAWRNKFYIKIKKYPDYYIQNRLKKAFHTTGNVKSIISFDSTASEPKDAAEKEKELVPFEDFNQFIASNETQRNRGYAFGMPLFSPPGSVVNGHKSESSEDPVEPNPEEVEEAAKKREGEKNTQFSEVAEDRPFIYVWFYPRMAFKRVAITDSSEAYSQLFNLWQEGALPIGVLLDMYNLDPKSIEKQLKDDIGTVSDKGFRDFLSGVYGNIENADVNKHIMSKIYDSIGLKTGDQKITKPDEKKK